ncbi:hypothetical protein [Oceaniglobus ichthyenteri]|uniref:hypothetical protein n=1 Tax=Oceaniglobus ichthyenteri TaxID=2136177 RepID=UPI000D35C7B8|nr:hypothetical protein [Oceaniglobus ichthyenteri]
MKRALFLATAVALATAMPAFAHQKHYNTGHSGGVNYGGTVTVSCYRGPWNDVIWDRPNGVFIDSLVAVGYDLPTAHAIGERICRDPALVYNPDRLRAEAIRVLRNSPARRGKYHRNH